MTRTCHLKCDRCGAVSDKHETLGALSVDTLLWAASKGGLYHTCPACLSAPVTWQCETPPQPYVPEQLDWSDAQA